MMHRNDDVNSRSSLSASRILCKKNKTFLSRGIYCHIALSSQICRPPQSRGEKAWVQGTLFRNVPHLPNASGLHTIAR